MDEEYQEEMNEYYPESDELEEQIDDEYYGLTAEEFAAKHPGQDPKHYEDKFKDYEAYQEALINHRVQKAFAGMPPPPQPEIPDVRDDDDYAIEKSQIVAQIQKYREDERNLTATRQFKQALHCRQMAESFEKDFHRLETEHPTPEYQRAYDRGLGQYTNDLENAVNDASDFEDRRARASSEAQFYKDCMQRIKAVNAATAGDDDKPLYYLNGDSKFGRLSDYHVAKVDLPKGVKEQILRAAEFKGTIYDVLVSYGYIPKMEPMPGSKDPEHMTQAEYEAWRNKSGARPKYLSPLTGLVREKHKQ
jgi:hypothetical protein